MSADTRFEMQLAEWLGETATETGAAAVYERGMTEVRRKRPRSTWLVVVRGGTMGSTARRLGRAGRTTVYLLLVLGLILALVAAVIVGGRLMQARLAAPYGPADNGTISFSRDGDIWRANPDGTDPRLLIDDEHEDGWPLYSPDGSKFIFDRTLPDGGHQVMVANADGTDAMSIAEVPLPLEEWTWTDWSPDSQSLVVMWSGPGGRVLSILHTNGDPPTTLDLGDLIPTEFASWRPPDGKEIIFEASYGGLGPRGIHAIGADGLGLRPIGEPNGGTTCPDCLFQQPALSPLGDTMAFSNYETSEAGVTSNFLHLRHLDTGADEVIPLDPGWAVGARFPRFTPDGRSVVFETAPHVDDPALDGQLVIAPIDGSAPARPLGSPYATGDLESFDISPDGTRVILDLAGVTWFIDTSTGEATKATEYLPNQPSWQRR